MGDFFSDEDEDMNQVGSTMANVQLQTPNREQVISQQQQRTQLGTPRQFR